MWRNLCFVAVNKRDAHSYECASKMALKLRSVPMLVAGARRY